MQTAMSIHQLSAVYGKQLGRGGDLSYIGVAHVERNIYAKQG